MGATPSVAALGDTNPSDATDGDNNFNDFFSSENQLTIDFAILCKPIGGTLVYHRCPLASPPPQKKKIFGGKASPPNIWWNGVPLRSPRTPRS